MRTLLIILLVIAAVLGALALYLFLTTPGDATPLRVPLSAAQRELLARVPAAADSFALIPTAALLHRRLLANPVSHDVVARWTSEQPVPSPLLIGGGDVVAWKIGKRTSYAIRLDPLRAFLVRAWMMGSSDVAARWDGRLFVINATQGPPIDARTLDELLQLANGLEGNVLAVQRNPARGVFPPIGRPSVSVVGVTPREIVITSRALEGGRPVRPPEGGRDVRPPDHPPVQARFPRGALLSATFARPPRILDDVERLLGTDLSALVEGGGAVALYDIDAGTLLPRPKGVIVVPSSPEARVAMDVVIRVADVLGETRDTGRELLVSFDRQSAGLYSKDAFVPATWPANLWALRIDAARIVPILERLGDNRGLRIVAPRLHRAARDLRRWIAALQNAEAIEASDSLTGGVEELRVRIASK
ncbi:MAG TPA: hypothetical protein VNA69_06875 [Thermoanaerobaculia bacterium]|nr:hypothetical protein [Thermoanaerobaculia bacterium]